MLPPSFSNISFCLDLFVQTFYLYKSRLHLILENVIKNCSTCSWSLLLQMSVETFSLMCDDATKTLLSQKIEDYKTKIYTHIFDTNIAFLNSNRIYLLHIQRDSACKCIYYVFIILHVMVHTLDYICSLCCVDSKWSTLI